MKSDTKIHKNIDLYKLAENGKRMPTHSPFPAYPLEKSAMFFQEYIRLFSIPRQIIPYNVHTDILYCIGMYIIGYSRQIHEDRPLIGVHPIWTT